MRYAYIENGKVVEITRVNPFGIFNEGYASKFVEVPDDVEAVIAGIQDPQEKRAAQIEYEADTWERNNPFLLKMWEHIGGNSTTLIELFITAASL